MSDKCVGCDACAQACPSYKDNEFNFGMDKTKAAYLPFEQAFPFQYVIDSKHCSKDCMKACFEACKYNAIDLDMKPEKINLKAGAVVLATGWNPYDISKLDILGSGTIKNVITNMMMERLASIDGPTKGKIVRPSDGKEIKNIAFVQCAGSRDENHLPYCSYICCLATLKHAMYIKEQYPAAKMFLPVPLPVRKKEQHFRCFTAVRCCILRNRRGATATAVARHSGEDFPVQGHAFGGFHSKR